MGIETTWPEMKTCVNHPRIQSSDENVNQVVDLAFSAILELSKRHLHFSHGLPRRQVLLLSDNPVTRAAFLEEFQSDLANFEKLKAATFPGQELILKRSVFNKPCVAQLKLCLEQEGWQATHRIPMDGHPNVYFFSLCVVQSRVLGWV